MLPEAIAIVMAPSKTPSQGIFRLTDPPGMDIITTCRDARMFHPHNVDDYELYEAIDGGHVKLVNSDLDIVDLRK